MSRPDPSPPKDPDPDRGGRRLVAPGAMPGCIAAGCLLPLGGSLLVLGLVWGGLFWGPQGAGGVQPAAVPGNRVLVASPLVLLGAAAALAGLVLGARALRR